MRNNTLYKLLNEIEAFRYVLRLFVFDFTFSFVSYMRGINNQPFLVLPILMILGMPDQISTWDGIVFYNFYFLIC